jgi:hypothetical protein
VGLRYRQRRALMALTVLDLLQESYDLAFGGVPAPAPPGRLLDPLGRRPPCWSDGREADWTRLWGFASVRADQSVVDRMLKVGSIDFDTAGTDDSEFSIRVGQRPERVVRAVNDAIHESETRREPRLGEPR